MTIERAALTVLVAIAALASGPPAAQAKTESAGSGPVSAAFSYTADRDNIQFKNLKLVISRAGAPVLTTTLPGYRDYRPGGAIAGKSVAVRDLDGDGEPEVVLNLFSGGASCCLGTIFYTYRAATNDYAAVFRDFGRYGFAARQLDGTRPLELVTADIRFSGAFGTVTADQRAPVRVLQFVRGRFRDVTRANPASLRRDLRAHRREYPRFVRAKANRRGILASIVADQLLLNDGAGAAKTFDRIRVAYGNGFTKRLKLFLARRGYSLQVSRQPRPQTAGTPAPRSP